MFTFDRVLDISWEAGRPNPRPVRLDGSGRIYEVTGEPPAVPGLGPGAVRAGPADLRAGRVRRLGDVANPPSEKVHTIMLTSDRIFDILYTAFWLNLMFAVGVWCGRRSRR